jgi:DNA-binding MarR family transcriptional regulator
MNMNEITAFTIVAQQPGIVIDHIREEMGDISASSVSRIIDRLSDRTSHGMALVTKEETFFEGSVAPRKTKAVYLTTKGEALLNQVGRIVIS